MEGYGRAYTNVTLIMLREVLNQSLDSVSVDLIGKYCRRAGDYERHMYTRTRESREGS